MLLEVDFEGVEEDTSSGFPKVIGVEKRMFSKIKWDNNEYESHITLYFNHTLQL